MAYLEGGSEGRTPKWFVRSWDENGFVRRLESYQPLKMVTFWRRIMNHCGQQIKLQEQSKSVGIFWVGFNFG